MQCLAVNVGKVTVTTVVKRACTAPHCRIHPPAEVSTVLIRELNGQESRIKKRAAKILVGRLEAEKISRDLYRRLALSPAQERERRLEVIRTLYIPDKMPSREVPGCFFREPQSDTWKIQHRTVTFAAASHWREVMELGQ